MSHKRKGIDAERALVRSFWEHGWAAIRVAGSGSSQYPSPDLLVGRYGRRFAIESKVTAATRKYISHQDIRHLQYFANTFGAEVWLAVKFKSKPWRFFSLEDIDNTAKSVVISVDMCGYKGLSFEELIDC